MHRVRFGGEGKGSIPQKLKFEAEFRRHVDAEDQQSVEVEIWRRVEEEIAARSTSSTADRPLLLLPSPPLAKMRRCPGRFDQQPSATPPLPVTGATPATRHVRKPPVPSPSLVRSEWVGGEGPVPTDADRTRCSTEERNPAANEGRVRCVSCRRRCWREERDPGGVLWRRRGGEGREGGEWGTMEARQDKTWPLLFFSFSRWQTWAFLFFTGHVGSPFHADRGWQSFRSLLEMFSCLIVV